MASHSVLFEFDPLALTISQPSSPSSSSGGLSPQINEGPGRAATQDPMTMTAFFDKISRPQQLQENDRASKKNQKRAGLLVDLMDESLWDDGPSLDLVNLACAPEEDPSRNPSGDFSLSQDMVAEVPKPTCDASSPATADLLDISTPKPSHISHVYPSLLNTPPPQLTARVHTPKTPIHSLKVTSPSPAQLPQHKPTTTPRIPSPLKAEASPERPTAAQSNPRDPRVRRRSSLIANFRTGPDASRRISLDFDATVDMRFTDSSFDLLNGDTSFLDKMHEMDESDSSIIIPSLESKLAGCVQPFVFRGHRSSLIRPTR